MGTRGPEAEPDSTVTEGESTETGPVSRTASLPERDVEEASPWRGIEEHVALGLVASELYSDGRELARGGQGRVSTARDRRLGRRVAIKELLSRDERAAARFEREIRITARLQHPNIIQIHEAGRWRTGEPFYAMTLVDGRPLDKVIAERSTTSERLALVSHVIAVVDALAYAHSQGVIHRDLKPNNVLIGPYGETVVIDWGLAKDTASADDDSEPSLRPAPAPLETHAGAVIGTPAYMAPEQAAGEKVDARADVYALGAMLYSVLAGAPPYRARNSDELIAQVKAGPPRPLAELVPEAPSDLVAIVDKAMARDPDDRFPTAQEMANELRRFEAGQLIRSHRYTLGELARRWVRRHRTAVTVGAVAVITLAIVGLVSVSRIVRAERTARAAQVRAEHQADTILVARAREALTTDPTEALQLLTRLDRSTAETWDAARPIAADASSRGVARVLSGARGDIASIALSPTRLAAGGNERVVRLWDLATGRTRELGHTASAIVAVGLEPSAVLAATVDGELARCTDTGGGCQVVSRIPGPVVRAVFSPDGRQALVITERVASLWHGDSATLEPLGAYQRGAWSPDGASLVLASGSSIDRHDVASKHTTRVVVGDANDPAISAVAADGARILAARRGDHRVYEAIAGQLLEHHAQHARPIAQLAFAGEAVVSTDTDREYSDSTDAAVRFRSGDHPVIVSRAFGDVDLLLGHRGNIGALAATSDGTMVATGDTTGSIRVWHAMPTRRLADHTFRDTSAAALADGGRVALLASPTPAGAPRRVDVIELSTGATRSLVTTENAEAPRRVAAIHVAADGRRFVTVADGEVVAWSLDAALGRVVATNAALVAVSHDGGTLAFTRGSELFLARTTRDDVRSLGTPGMIRAIACSPTGDVVAVATTEGVVLLGRQRHTLKLAGDSINVLAFSPDGATLAGGGAQLHTWNLATEIHIARGGHLSPIEHLAFSADGHRLASAGSDGTLLAWALQATDAPIALTGFVGRASALVFDATNSRLVASGADRATWMWDLPSGHGRPLPAHYPVVRGVGFADARVVVIDGDGAVWLHADAAPRGERALRPWLARTLAPAPPSTSDATMTGRRLHVQLACRPHPHDACDTFVVRTQATTRIDGDPRRTFELTLRLRGVVERQAFDATGAATESAYNIYALRVSSPPQLLPLNAGDQQRRTWIVDETRTVRVTGGAVLTLSADTRDFHQIENRDDRGQPLVPAGETAPFDGQFLTIDIVEIKPVDG